MYLKRIKIIKNENVVFINNFKKKKNHTNYYKITSNDKIKKLIIIIFLAIILSKMENMLSSTKNDILKCKQEKLIFNQDNKYSKWIVLNVFNPPSSFIINLEKIIKDWKIVIIGNNNTNDKKWQIFNDSERLIYLSIEIQNCLKYNLTKYLKVNSSFRKSLGYLYAIEHGAKEIFEIDENLEFHDLSKINNHFEKCTIAYVSNNNSLQINPYIFFGNENIWPRGFRLSDIGKQSEKYFYYGNSSNTNLKPLIFQGLINNIPDLDDIFCLTRKKINNSFIFNSISSIPLFYFPNNYIPINSKNTRYLYDIFPFLMFPTSIDENIADIWRGYIIEYFVWKLRGSVIYYNFDANKKTDFENNMNLIKNKKNYFELNKFLDILYLFSNKDIIGNQLELFNELITHLIENKLLVEQDLDLYRVYLNDLISIGYNFTSFSLLKNEKINYPYLKTVPEFKLYIPSSLFIIKNNFQKLMNHYNSNHKYTDILLIVNYNHIGFLQLNSYIISLYKKNFPNIIFIYPSEINETNIISCNESYKGFYLYKCFNKVYLKYPKFKGYLVINDDVFLKTWELVNLNFDIPWIYQLVPLVKRFHFYPRCYKLYNMVKRQKEWHNRIIQFNGYFDIFMSKADLFYLPNEYALKLLNLFNIMYNSSIFLECAFPTSIGILLAPKYQIIYFLALEGYKARKNVINFLYNNYNQITIHPVKFSITSNQNKINLYLLFINANGY